MANSILFICTGNYYRSRFAEIYFNYLAEKQKLGIKAFSRGLEVFRCRNLGAISSNTLYRIQHHGINLSEIIPNPQQIEIADFEQATLSIAMDKTEHHPMMQQYHPDWAAKIEYWDFEDVQFADPGLVLPALEQKIESFVSSLALTSNRNSELQVKNIF